MNEPQMTIVTVLAVEQYRTGWPPTKATEFREWLEGHLSRIPAEHMGSARIEIGSDTSDDLSTANLEITYQRPETPEEVKLREDGQAARRSLIEQSERAQLEALKRKYGEGK